MPRRSPRAVIFWAGAILVAIATATIVATDLAALHRRAHSLGAPRPVAVAARDLPRGRRVRRGDPPARPVRRSQLPPGPWPRGLAERRVVAVPGGGGALVAGGTAPPRGGPGREGAPPRGRRARGVAARGAFPPPV